MRIRSYWSFVLLFFFACSSEGEKEEIVREPSKVVIKDNISIEVYDFEHIEPFLYRENDQINVINFWATWCLPCIAELPAFEKLNAIDPEVQMTLISLDFATQIESALIPYVKENDLEAEVILLDDPDANDWIPKIDENWSGAIPATIIYTEEKRKFYERSFTFEELKTEVETFRN